MITWIKNVNDFQKSAFAWFFANFSLTLRVKVLLINKATFIIKNFNPHKKMDVIIFQLVWYNCVFESVLKPVKYLLESSLTAGSFRRGLEKRQHYSSPQTRNQELLKQLQTKKPASYIHKILERPIFNALFNFFVQNQLFTDCRPGSIPPNPSVL